MEPIIRLISNLEDMRHLMPASAAQVREAERALGLRFAPDYAEYVQTYGAISARGLELTGVTRHQRLNVAAVTQQERALNPLLPRHMYVIENIGIDGLLALQEESGRVYTIAPNQPPQLLCDSLSAYVERAGF